MAASAVIFNEEPPKTSFHKKSYDTVAAISGEKKTSKREITNASEGKVEDN